MPAKIEEYKNQYNTLEDEEKEEVPLNDVLCSADKALNAEMPIDKRISEVTELKNEMIKKREMHEIETIIVNTLEKLI